MSMRLVNSLDGLRELQIIIRHAPEIAPARSLPREPFRSGFRKTFNTPLIEVQVAVITGNTSLFASFYRQQAWSEAQKREYIDILKERLLDPNAAEKYNQTGKSRRIPLAPPEK